MLNWFKKIVKKEEKEITDIYISSQCRQKMLHTPLHMIFNYDSNLTIFGCQRVLSNVTDFFPPTVLSTLTWKVDIGEKNCIAGIVATRYFYEGFCTYTGIGKWARLTSPDTSGYIDMSITDCGLLNQLHFGCSNMVKGTTVVVNHLSFTLNSDLE